MSSLPKSVEIFDDTMREGFQIESVDIPVSGKLRVLDALGETGTKRISIGSFVSPKYTPQMACIDEIAEKFVPKPGITYTALTMNPRGFERADKYYPKINVRMREYATSVDLSDIFARRNVNRSQAQQIASWDNRIKQAKEAAAEHGAVGLSNPFGSNFEGDVPLEEVMRLLQMQVDHWHESGFTVKGCNLSDANGWNMPDQVKKTLYTIMEKWPEMTEFRCHLHNTRGVTIASYYEAFKLGVRKIQTSLGGMAGCPYCGNGQTARLVPTEDMVYMCEEMGIETGYDLDKVIEAAVIAEEVVGHPLWGHVSKSGPRPRGNKLYPKDMPLVETLEEASHFRKGPSVYANQIRPWKEGDPLLDL